MGMGTRVFALAAAVAAAALALGSASTARAGDGSLLGCGDTAQQPFLRWLDPLPYTLAPDGGFEAGAAGWTLAGGARVVSGNEPYNLSGAGSRSLLLPDGSSATSPPMCVGLVLPIVRFTSVGGKLLSSLKVEVLYTDVFGARRSIELPPGALPSKSWQPTLPLLQLGGTLNALTLNGVTTDVSFRFTPRGVLGGGDWRIDDLYVDPWKGV